MKVLYVSKAMVVAAYREKLRELRRVPEVEVEAWMPSRWGTDLPEASPEGVPEPRRVPTVLHGHNHLHLYWRPGRRIGPEAPDLAHVDEEPYSLVTLQLARLCRRRGVPFLFFSWQNLPKALPPPFGALRRRVYRAARGGIAGTEGARRVLEETGFRGPVAVIPQFGVDPGRFAPDEDARSEVRKALGIPADAFTVGYGGRLVAEKGVDHLLAAFARLGAGPRLVVIGDGPERKRLEAAVPPAATDRVHFTGHVPSLEMPSRLAALDALVLPSVGSSTWSEQFGRILVEAMACGVPVVGTRCGEIPDVMGDAGEAVPPGSPGAIAEALDALRRSPGLREERSARGRRRVLERFTHERVADATAAFYDDLLDGPVDGEGS